MNNSAGGACRVFHVFDGTDPRAEAFRSFLPLSSAIQAALDTAQEAVKAELEVTGKLRHGVHASQHRGVVGSTRFMYLAPALRANLSEVLTAVYCSTASDEAQGLYLWLVDGRYVLRVKSDPTDMETVHPGVMQLFHGDSPVGATTVYLTWDAAIDHGLKRIRLATLAEPRWTIPMAEFVNAQTPVIGLGGDDAGARVRSKRLPRREEGASEKDG